MSNASKSTNNQKFRIDNSIEKKKYRSRYDRLLNILFHSDEIPSDLYTQMNLSYENFKNAIKTLRKRNLIKTITNNRIIGYRLASGGKKLVHEINYMKYAICLDEKKDQHFTQMKYRNRKRQFAYLYALLDRAGITYESFLKPPLSRSSIKEDRVYFYTALEFKRMLGIESTVFMGSRTLGFFIGKGKIISVYRTNQLLKTFGSEESSLIYSLKQSYNISVSEAILICDNDEAVIDITNQIVQGASYEKKSSINTGNYNNFYVISSGDNFSSCFNDLYKDHRSEEQELIASYSINTSDKDSRGRKRVLIATGTIEEGNPILVCPGYINVVILRRLLLNSKGKRSYIICKERDKNYITQVSKNYNIGIINI